MYRILLADDEGIMLNSLSSIINSYYGKECEIQCAKTGRALVEIADSFRPDIAFVDIQMPGLNGISAMKEIRKTNESVIFIVVSAFDKFDYAREAINLGVMEYITKPINKKTVLDTLQQAINQVNEARENRSINLKIREKLEIVIPMLESGFIYNVLLQDDYDSTMQDGYLNLLDIKQQYGFMLVIPFGEDVENGILTNTVGISVKAQGFYQEMRGIIKDFFDCLIGPLMGNRIVVFVPWEQSGAEYEDRLLIISRGHNCIHKLEEKIDARFRMGIGSVKVIADARSSYHEAIRALHENTGHIVHIKDIIIEQEKNIVYPTSIKKRFIQMVQRADITGASDQGNLFFEWMKNNYEGHRDDMISYCLEILLAAKDKCMPDEEKSLQDICQVNMIMDLQECHDNDALLKDWFGRNIRALCRSVQEYNQEKPMTVITKAKEYINQHYHKDISLNDVSREVDISPYYFSKLFKQETGANFIEYLTDIRIKKAKDLLENSDLSIKEICSMSGYSDPNYFSRIFKKYEGITPSEYKEKQG